MRFPVIAQIKLNAPSNKSNGEWLTISAYKGAAAVVKCLHDILLGLHDNYPRPLFTKQTDV